MRVEELDVGSCLPPTPTGWAKVREVVNGNWKVIQAIALTVFLCLPGLSTIIFLPASAYHFLHGRLSVIDRALHREFASRYFFLAIPFVGPGLTLVQLF